MSCPRPLVKICGITNMDDAILSMKLGADFLGVILDKAVVRHGDRSLIGKIADAGGYPCAVYTSMDQFRNSGHNESMAQLHFPFTREDLDAFRSEGIPVIGVSASNFPGDFNRRFRDISAMGVRYVLVDFRDGIRNHLGELELYTRAGNVGLGGKLDTPDLESVLLAEPALIDLSSSLELYPGKKDRRKLEVFFSRLEALCHVNA